MCSSKTLCDSEDCKQCFEKSFASHDKARFWSQRNEISPRDVFKSSGNKYWFDCECGHSFDSVLASINNGVWCPYCSNKKLCDSQDCQTCFEKSFSSHDKARFWSQKNDKKPRDVFKSSHNKHWFDCECGHVFSNTLNAITRGNWCPYCSNQKLCDVEDCQTCFEKSFASSDKARFWSQRNEISPRDVFKSSGNKYWFDCECGHSFDCSLGNISSGNWCPYCSNPPKKLCDLDNCKQCFEKSFASSNKVKFWSKRNEIRPRDVFKSSGNKYWFDCECGHSFDCSLGNISSGKWCPYCSNQKLCDSEDCEQCFEKSFASSDKVKFWSKRNEIRPRDVFKSSDNKYWFDCECRHSFDSVLTSINNGTWCPYCSNPPQKLCDSEDCEQCFEKSFASSEKVTFWSDRNEVRPRDVFKNCNNKYIFNCECGHLFSSALNKINSNCRWCPYCSHQKLCDIEDCQTCFEKSFASYEKARFWSDRNEKKPRDVFKSSNKKFWFQCDKKHQFCSYLNVVSKGVWCPYCINKTEQKLYEQLSVRYPTLKRQFRVEWCKKKQCLPYDFVIPDHKIIIELDGPQHFIQVANWSSPEEQQENDKYKETCANDHGYSVIRLTQEDVFYDTYDWLNELDQQIKMIIEGDMIQNIYMSHMDHYDNHI